MGERLKPVEFTSELARTYSQTFIPRWDRYPIQQANGKYIQCNKPLIQELVIAHLVNHYRGKESVTLGAYALNQESQASWICLDADTYEQWSAIWKLAQHLHSQNIPSYAESSRRGGHLWLFTPLLTGKDARSFGKHLLIQHDLMDKSIELYPKQDQLKEGAGSFVRLPLGVHRKTGQVYSFVNLKGEPLAPTIREQIAILANPDRVSHDYINDVLQQADSNTDHSPTLKSPKIKNQTDKSLSETLKQHISVYDFVSQYIQLDRDGKGLCPFHDDHHPSFQVHITDNYWHCYAGCGGGSIIDFAMKWREQNGEDASFTATIQSLAEMLL